MEREEWIDSAKGIAILLVVFGHVLSSYIVADMFKEHYVAMRYMFETIYSFHMPLYFLLSGYLYSKIEKTDTITDYKNLIIKKVIGLGIPYVIFSIMQGSIQILFSKFTNKQIGFETLLNIAAHPILQFWFIYTLMFIFIVISLMEISIKNERLILFTLFAFKIASFFIQISVVAVDTVMQFAVYFYFGKMLHKYCKEMLSNRKLLICISTIYIIMNMLCFVMLYDIYSNKMIENISNIILAISGSMLVIYIVNFGISKTEVLKKYTSLLGVYSFEIYIFHIIFSYGVKTVFLKLNVQSLLIHLFFGTLVGIVIPIVIGNYAKKIPLAYYIMYPNKFFRNKSGTQHYI